MMQFHPARLATGGSLKAPPRIRRLRWRDMPFGLVLGVYAFSPWLALGALLLALRGCGQPG